VPVERLSKAVVVTTDDDFRVGSPAYFYAYIADSFDAAFSGDPARGSLYVWKALNTADTAFTLTKGATIPGEFVPVTQLENANDVSLKAAATSKGAFRFARLEDAAVAQQRPGRVYVAETGKVGEATLRGRIYQFDIDPADPTRASLTLLLDADTGDDFANPDNMDTSSTSLVFQEDREAPFRAQYNRVLVYDLSSGVIRAAARVNTTVGPPGQWESSGVINAQTLLGGGWWLFDVQAHSLVAPQPGPAAGPGVQPVPNTATGEDGQLLAVYIPGS
jgi:secreted PhoX family phosphatase